MIEPLNRRGNLMSVALPIEEDPRFRRYTASAGQTVFSIPFPFQQSEDVSIQLFRNQKYEIIDRAAFMISGEMHPEGGSVTFHIGRAAGDVIVVVGDAVLDRLSSIARDGRFSSKLTDDELDRNRIIQQEQQRDIERSLKAPYGSVGATLTATGPSSLIHVDGSGRIISSETPINEKTLREDGDRAITSIIAQAGPIEVPVYDSRTAVSHAAIKSSVASIRTGGFFRPADGGEGLYEKVETEAQFGGVKSHDGAFWQLAFERCLVTLEQFGAVGDGVTADDSALREAIGYISEKGGGAIQLAGKKYLFAHSHSVKNVPIAIRGIGSSWGGDAGSVIIHATGNKDFLEFSSCEGISLENFKCIGSGVTGGFQFKFSNGCRIGYLANLRLSGGFNSIHYGQSFYMSHFNVRWADFNGQQVLLCNGIDDVAVPQAMEYVQCQVSPSTANKNTDLFVMDGWSASMKFSQCAFLFGRHGITMKNSFGSTTDPKFLYFNGGGFENGQGDCLRLETGTHAMIGPCYISSDGDGSGIYVGPDFAGPLIVSDAYIRGHGRDGIHISANTTCRTVISGGQISNNGSGSLTSFIVTEVNINTSTSATISTSTEHKLRVGDMIRVAGTGTSLDGNDYYVALIVSPTIFSLVGASLSGSFSGSGTIKRLNYGIRLQGACSNVLVDGVQMTALSGLNRQDRALRIGAGSTNVRVADSPMSATAAQTGFINNSNSQTVKVQGNLHGYIDGAFDCNITGAIGTATTLDFDNMKGFLYLRRIRLIGITASVAAGSLRTNINVDGTPIMASVLVTTTQTTTTFSSPVIIDSIDAAKRVQLSLGSLSGSPSGLRVSYHWVEEN